MPLNSTRLHTSAASVVVMMEAEDVDVTLNPRWADKETHSHKNANSGTLPQAKDLNKRTKFVIHVTNNVLKTHAHPKTWPAALWRLKQ